MLYVDIYSTINILVYFIFCHFMWIYLCVYTDTRFPCSRRFSAMKFSPLRKTRAGTKLAVPFPGCPPPSADEPHTSSQSRVPRASVLPVTGSTASHVWQTEFSAARFQALCKLPPPSRHHGEVSFVMWPRQRQPSR